MMHTCTHEAARGYAPACPEAPCLPACLLVRKTKKQQNGIRECSGDSPGDVALRSLLRRPQSNGVRLGAERVPHAARSRLRDAGAMRSARMLVALVPRDADLELVRRRGCASHPARAHRPARPATERVKASPSGARRLAIRACVPRKGLLDGTDAQSTLQVQAGRRRLH
eukprot:7298747-Prymnesium_polylepis.1